MPQPLFEVSNLRVAVFDPDRAVLASRNAAFVSDFDDIGDAGPTADTGEVLAPGWVEVLRGVSFSVAEGEVLALVGESASGKSLALMGGFALLSPGARVIGGTTRYGDVTFRPGGGSNAVASKRSRKERKEARLSGTVVADYDDPAWERTIGTEVGFIFQNPIGSWTPDTVIGEQSGEALATHSDLSAEEIEQRVFDALGEVELPKSRRLFGAFRHELSRGMAQRAMLAAALTKAPSLMIADEPLTGLDPPVSASIMELMRDMQSRRSMAMVMVTHDLAAVAGLADRVAVLYGGEIVEEGPVEDIYHRPRHPYTSGLIGSIPGARRGRLRSIRGEAPRLIDIDHDRCVFLDRCDFASSRCEAEKPPALQFGPTSVACHHADATGLPGVGA